VRVLLRAAEDVLEVLAAAPLDSAARTHAEVVLALSFAPIWGRIDVLTLDIGADAVAWSGQPVLDGADGGAILIPVLRSAGISSITLLRGVEQGEVQLFLAAVDHARRRSGGPGGDLVTMLFRADLRHLRYGLRDPGGPGEQADRPTPPLAARPPGLGDALRREAMEARPSGVVRTEEFDPTLYFLDEREVAYLKSAIDEEYSGSAAQSAISLLFETLEARTEQDVRAEVLDALCGLLPSLLSTGHFEDVTHLISEARRASQSPRLDQAQRAALERLRGSVSDARAVEQLFHALEDGDVRATPEAIRLLMRELRPEAIRSVMLWPDQMSNRDAGAAVVRAIESFFEEWPLALGRMLALPDRAVVHAALAVALRGKHPDFAELVAQRAHDPDPTTRLKVAGALAAIGTPQALKLLTQMASDADGDVRASVFAAFASRPSRTTVSILEPHLSAPDLEQRGEREKRALFEAYAASAGDAGIETLERVLRGRVKAGRRPSVHTRACAARALGRIGTARAREVLGGASEDREPVVRSAVNAALRENA
jgi:hypothetical protein